MNWDCDVSYPNELNNEGIQFISVYWIVFIPISTKEPQIVLFNNLPLNNAEYGKFLTAFASTASTGGNGLPVDASISFSIDVMIASASSTLPWDSNQRGDSGYLL